MDSTLSDLIKDLYGLELEDFASVLESFCKENAQKGVVANEALKRIVDYLLQNMLYSDLPDEVIRDIRSVGLFIEELTLNCT